MSDMFDHEAIAWESYESEYCEPGEEMSHRRNNNCKVNHNYYHHRLHGISFLKENASSFLIRFPINNSDSLNMAGVQGMSVDLWVPKKIIRNIEKDSALFHSKTLLSIFKKEKDRRASGKNPK